MYAGRAAPGRGAGGAAAIALPHLIVGDVHGDLERLFQALARYPADSWHTVFLGDLVDGGPFGAGALRYARDRPNSDVLLGNHEVLMLWTLRDRDRLSFWVSAGGQPHDLAELERDPELAEWLRTRPLLLRLDGATVAQHSDSDRYLDLLPPGREGGDLVAAVNLAGARLLREGAEHLLDEALTAKHVFRDQPARLERWLLKTGCERVVHGHAPHASPTPLVYAGGRAIDFDGGMGRWGGHGRRGRHPFAGTVGPLPTVAAAEPEADLDRPAPTP